MPWNDSNGPVPDQTEAEFLALVRRRAAAADAAQRRRHRAVAGAAALLMIVGFATAVVRRGPEPATQLMTTGVGATSSTSVELSPTSLATTSTLGVTLTVPPTVPTTRVAAVTPPTTPTTRAPAAPASTTTTLVCRDSYEEACGPLRWDPPLPANKPLTVAVTSTPASPKPGETVTFHVVVDDPDGDVLVDRTGISNDYGDGPPAGGVAGHRDCHPQYGPWTPPPPTPVHADLTFQHTYATAGAYVTKFPFKSIGDCAYGPSEATGTVTVTVAA